MSEHPDLVGLLRGELTNAEVVDASAHLEDCVECRDELAVLVPGHALMASAARTLVEPASYEPPSLPPLADPGPSSWRRWTRPFLLVAAALVLVVGTLTVTALVGGRDDAPPVARQTAQLEPVEGSGGGKVVMTEHDESVRMTITTQDLPDAAPGDYYYAWLFDPSTEKMLALGVVDPDGASSFDLPTTLVGRYQVVDVSLETDDGDPGHSVTSVLRADYGAAVAASR